jgi:predicted ArsR family transcriptional regulator
MYNGVMKTSRQRVLDYIRLHNFVTAVEISRTLRMTPANARYHLSVLADQGVIEVISDRPTGGKGRPAQVFTLRSRTVQGLEILAGAALEVLENNLNAGGENSALRLLALYLADGSSEDVYHNDSSTKLDTQQDQSIPRLHLTQRLYNAVTRLIELGYAARWEARVDAPRMILGNCPYATILENHPQLCRMDEFLLEALLQVPVKQAAKLAHDTRGVPYCMFIVGGRQEPG